MKNIYLLIFLVFISTIAVLAQKLAPKERLVFDQIAYHRIKVGEYEKITKWVVPIRYKIVGDSSKYIINEIDSIFSQLKRLTNLDIQKSDDNDEVNFMIALSTSPEALLNMTNNFAKYTNNYGGYFYRTNKKSEIYRMECLFAVEKYKSKSYARYAVRRGIIRSMGFFKQTNHAPSSIFYAEANHKLKFDAFDSAIISAFYSENIKPGMTKEEVDPLLQ